MSTAFTPMPTDTPVVEIRDLHKSCGPPDRVKGDELVDPRGNVLSLAGLSASSRHLADAGRVMILGMHDMQLAADRSDHVVVLTKGRIKEECPPASLSDTPQSAPRGFLPTKAA
jgi:ABC-type histidine transport system ATPase subunit